MGGYLIISGKADQIFRLESREYAFYLIAGVLNPFVYYLMVMKAYDLLPTQVAQPINHTWIMTLSLLSVPLLKQPFTKSQVTATLVCYPACKATLPAADKFLAIL